MSAISQQTRALCQLLCVATLLGALAPALSVASARQDLCPGLKARLAALEQSLATVNAALEELDEEQTLVEELWSAGNPSCYDLNNRALIHNFVHPNAFIVGAFCTNLVIGFRAILADIAQKRDERNGLLNQIEFVKSRLRGEGCIKAPVELPDDEEELPVQ